MFDKSLEIAELLKKKIEIERKTLPLETKVQIAQSCLEKAKSRKDLKEYQEINLILKQLNEEYDLEQKGLSKKPEYLTAEEIDEYSAVIKREAKDAENAYKKLLKQVDSIRLNYLKEMEPVLKEIVSIVSSNIKVGNIMGEAIPMGHRLVNSQIPLSISQADRGYAQILGIIEINKNLKKRRLG